MGGLGLRWPPFYQYKQQSNGRRFDVRECVGEEARPGRNVWGGRLPVVWGEILIDKKNTEMGGPFALDGRRLMGGHNNQPKVGINGGRSIEKERQLGRNMWGGVVSLLGAAN